MKNIHFKTILTAAAMTAFIAVSGCAANEVRLAAANGISQTGSVTALETAPDSHIPESTETSDEAETSDETETPDETETHDETEISEETEISAEDISEEDIPEYTGSEEDEDAVYGDMTEEYEDPAEPEEININGPDFHVDNGTYPCSVILLGVDENTTDEMIQEVIEKYSFGIVYDYDNLNMYAFSLPEPLDCEATQKLIGELEAYDFILYAEPDQVIYLDDPVICNDNLLL